MNVNATSARATQIVTSAKALSVGYIVLERTEVTRGGTKLHTPGGTVAAIEAGGPVVTVTYEDGSTLVCSAFLQLDVVTPWPAS